MGLDGIREAKYLFEISLNVGICIVRKGFSGIMCVSFGV